MTTSAARKVKWLPGIVFVLVGAALLVASMVLSQRTQTFLLQAVRAEGVVVDLSAGSQHPSITYALPSGEKLTFAAGGWLSGYHLQQRVHVLYLAETPTQSAQLDDPGALWFATRLTAFLGSAQLLVGLAAMFVRAKQTS
jgi:hypothetical protein